MSLSRRAFIENSAILIATVGVPSVSWSDSAPMLSESDPTALALGYKANASTVDKAKYAQYAPGQSCSSLRAISGSRRFHLGSLRHFRG